MEYNVDAPCSNVSIFSKFMFTLADLIAAVFSLVTDFIISSLLFASSGLLKSKAPSEHEILNQHACARIDAYKKIIQFTTVQAHQQVENQYFLIGNSLYCIWGLRGLIYDTYICLQYLRHS